MVSNISASRLEIKKYFDSEQKVDGSEHTSISPSGRYKLESISYRQNKPSFNWTVTKVSIYDTQSGILRFEFFTDYHSFFHEWITKENSEFLIGAEVLCGGQTVLNLTTKDIESYSPGDESNG